MKPTEFQKIILRKMEATNSFTAKQFFIECCDLQEVSYAGPYFSDPGVGGWTFSPGLSAWLAVDQSEVFIQCLEFDSLISTLENEKLVKVYKLPRSVSNVGLLPVCMKGVQQAHVPFAGVVAILGQYSDSLIQPLVPFKDFLKKGYSTKDDLSRRWVVRSAVIGAIIGSVVTATVSSLIGLLPSSNERAVTIRKIQSDEDTVNVRLVSPPAKLADSLGTPSSHSVRLIKKK